MCDLKTNIRVALTEQKEFITLLLYDNIIGYITAFSSVFDQKEFLLLRYTFSGYIVFLVQVHLSILEVFYF